MQSIILDNVLNVRDIGGYNSDLGKIKYNTIIRGQVPYNISNYDKSILSDMNLEVIDLRTEEEKKQKKSYFYNEYNDINLKRTRWPKTEKEIPYTYIEVLEDYSNVRKILEIILESKKTIYINCNLGKDRTGVIIMLIMLLCHVKEEDIIADYTLSDIYLRKNYLEFHEKNKRYPKYLGRAKPEYIEKTLEIFKKKYGNINCYMKVIGISPIQQQILQEKLIIKNE